MKVVILAGGLGTRLAEETVLVPKPMVEIGGEPIIWHIMRGYAQQGFKDFVLTLGYKSLAFKRYVLDHRLATESLSVDLASGSIELHEGGQPLDWRIDLLETGLHTQTSGRVARALPVIGRERFMLTYGDGVSDVDLQALLAFHESHGRLATITVVRPTSLFGHMSFDQDQIVEFLEKPQTLGGWINGGFMVFEPGVADYLGGDDAALEPHTLAGLAKDGELFAYRHHGFWQSMDSLRDKRLLEDLWASGEPPWKTWR